MNSLVVNYQKSLEKRLNEIMNIYKKLDELGISEDVCSNIKKFKQIANNFVKNGESQSGKIILIEVQRTLHYILSIQNHIESTVRLSIMK